MNRTRVLIGGLALCLLSTAVLAQDLSRDPDPYGSNPPVRQEIGLVDTELHLLLDSPVLDGDGNPTGEIWSCATCHDDGTSQNSNRHHVLYGTEIIDGSVVPYPDTNGDGETDENYSCLSCHGTNFEVTDDCSFCHDSESESPHHQGEYAQQRQCTECHGDLVDDFNDGHTIPTSPASFVTPWTGLHGDGWNDPDHTSPWLNPGSPGVVLDSDVLLLDTGKIVAYGVPETRTDPAELRFKPAGNDNDFMIDDPGRTGTYTYSVVFEQGAALAAVWNPATDTLTVTVAPSQTAEDLVAAIQAAVALTDDDNGKVRAQRLTTDGTGDPLDPEDYEPLGGQPFNSRLFTAGSCSYCHDHDGGLDVNGDLDAFIVDNHDTHHHINLTDLPVDNNIADPGVWFRCNVCHDWRNRGNTYSEDSGPAFDLHIRICEECHGYDSLHNIQADSPNDANIGTIVVGGEDPGYGHVGADGGPGASDCWGCHGFEFAGSSTPPGTGPIIPTVYDSDIGTATAGSDTTIVLSGTGFINEANGQTYESVVTMTAADGTSVTLEPDILTDEGVLAVTIPDTTAPGNYRVRAKKDDQESNPTVITVTPQVKIARASVRRGQTTIRGSGFAGYVAGSGTEVTGTYIAYVRGRPRTRTMTANVLSWNDTRIVVTFPESPRSVSVQSVFGMGRYTVRSR